MSESNIDEIFVSERECLKEKIITLLEKSKTRGKPIAIAINGEWGIGKTHLWKHELTPLIKEKFGKSPIYTSVFGKKDEQAIIQDLVVRFLQRENGILNKAKSLLNKAIPIITKLKTGIAVNVDTSFFFDSLSEKDLSETVVCIDDFERLSDKIQPQDVLGLISELKEQKNCWVIVLYNKEELLNKQEQKNNTNPETKETLFQKYYDKAIDRTFNFSPSTAEQVRAMGGHPVKTDFIAYPYMEYILNIDHMAQYSQTINLRQFERANLIYDELFDFLRLEEYPSDDFEKTYQYLLYPMVYAYYFSLHSDYFIPPNAHGVTGLFHPHSTISSEVLRKKVPEIGKHIANLSLSASYIPPQQLQLWLKNLTNKIIQDTEFHNNFLQKYQQANKDIKKASVEFFLENKDNLKAFPYIFGFRIFDYAFGEELDLNIKRPDAKSFSLKTVMENHKDECLNLLNRWCDSAYQYLSEDWQKDWGEYFWVDQYTFALPLKHAFEQQKIDLPQNDLISFFLN